MKHLFLILLLLPFTGLAQRNTTATETNPEFRLLAVQGDSLFKIKEYQNAVEAYTKALVIKEDKELNCRRGIAYMSLQEHGNAIADFTSVIDFPDVSKATFTTAYYLRGLCKLMSDKEYAPTGCEDVYMAKSLGFNIGEGDIASYKCP